MASALIAFISAFLLISISGFLAFYRQAAIRRLTRSISKPKPVSILRDEPNIAPGAKLEKLAEPFQRVLPRSSDEVSVVQKRLTRAGYREKNCVNILYGAKVFLPLALCLIVTLTKAYSIAGFFVYAAALGFGFLGPDYWLGNRIKARQTKIRLGLPEALDLIVICVEAGLSMDKATIRTTEELQLSQPEISDELSLVSLEQRAGRPRADAWKNFGDRTDVDTVRALASILIQADKFGTSVGKALRAHSETLRTRRRQDVEEKAAKTTVKLVFPLVLFIFPSLFVVTLGPSMIIMLEGFQKYF